MKLFCKHFFEPGINRDKNGNLIHVCLKCGKESTADEIMKKNLDGIVLREQIFDRNKRD